MKMAGIECMYSIYHHLVSYDDFVPRVGDFTFPRAVVVAQPPSFQAQQVIAEETATVSLSWLDCGCFMPKSTVIFV